MKKNIITLLSFFLIFSLFLFYTAEATTYNSWATVWDNLDTFLNNSSLVSWTDTSVSWWFKTKIITWVTTLGSILSLIAVWWIVYGSFQLVVSTGDDEKVKKGKDIIKWSILWFLALISAGSIIAIVVNIMYALW